VLQCEEVERVALNLMLCRQPTIVRNDSRVQTADPLDLIALSVVTFGVVVEHARHERVAVALGLCRVGGGVAGHVDEGTRWQIGE